MENKEEVIVKFHNDEIVCINGKVVIKRIAENIGLNTQSALRGIKNNKILAKVCTEEYATGADGKQYLMQVLPIEYVAGWLFSIEISQVNPEAQERLLIYQEHCHQVLFEYFFGKFKVITNVQKINAEKKKRNKEINRMVNALMIEHKENALIIEQNSNITLQQLGFWEEEAEITELPDHLTGKQFFLKKA